jgi:hypothetical protein
MYIDADMRKKIFVEQVPVGELVKVDRHLLLIKREKGSRFLAGYIEFAGPGSTKYLTLPTRVCNELRRMGINLEDIKRDHNKKVAEINILCDEEGSAVGVEFLFLGRKER